MLIPSDRRSHAGELAHATNHQRRMKHICHNSSGTQSASKVLQMSLRLASRMRQNSEQTAQVQTLLQALKESDEKRQELNYELEAAKKQVMIISLGVKTRTSCQLSSTGGKLSVRLGRGAERETQVGPRKGAGEKRDSQAARRELGSQTVTRCKSTVYVFFRFFLNKTLE